MNFTVCCLRTGLVIIIEFEDSVVPCRLATPILDPAMIPVLTDLSQIPNEFLGGSVAVGNFDGVHLGHASLIRQLVAQSNDLMGPALVVTFDPPPISVLRPEIPLLPPITPLQRRAELLGKLGVAAMIALPTHHGLLDLTPERFFRDVLLGQLRIRGMVEGPNFRFGKDRTGDIHLLSELCSSAHIAFQVVDSTNDANGMISSSRIRKLLAEGDVAAANAMLTKPFQISGLVSQGAGRGRRLVVPTANLTEVRSLIPAEGVYGGLVFWEDKYYRTAISIGPNPTFEDNCPKIELHLLQWQGELYGSRLGCDLLIRLRGLQKFNSEVELRNQIQTDVAKVIKCVPLT